jgi:hypothetical protein
MPVAGLVYQIVQSLVGNGYGQQDFATMIELQARASGLELVSEDVDVPDGLEIPDGFEAVRADDQHEQHHSTTNEHPTDTAR